ncbi:MAG: sugar phosphate nucleotidyltransferase [bacterium]
MQILIIAGGSGKRMQPLVTHKSVFPFLGQPILSHILNNLTIFKAQTTLIVAHPSVEQEIKVIARQYSAQTIVQSKSLGMADAVISAKNHLDSSSPVLIVDAITIQDPQVYSTFMTAITQHPSSILLGGRKVSEYKHGGYFVFDTHNHPTKIIEKPGSDNMPSPYLKLVLDYYPVAQTIIQSLESTQSTSDDVYEVALSKLMGDGKSKMVEVAGIHSSLKYAPRVLDVMEVFLTHYLTPGIDPTAAIASNATILGQVQIGRNVRVFENAVIKGPAYIGDNTVVGNGALIRESCIEEGCEIGYNTEVARSYVGPHTKCHTSYVGDSILEGQINLAAGTITANLRFDNRTVMLNLPSGRIDSGRRKFGAILAHGTKTGIHASLMPGTVTQPDSIIGTEVLYAHDKK